MALFTKGLNVGHLPSLSTIRKLDNMVGLNLDRADAHELTIRAATSMSSYVAACLTHIVVSLED